MSGTHTVVLGDRGRLVVPLAVRQRLGLEPGARLLLIEGESGMVLATRDQVRQRVRADLAGGDLVDELLTERRRAAAVEDRLAPRR